MGAGCSSPLRRFGGKRGKPSGSNAGLGGGENDNPENLTIAAKLQAQQDKIATSNKGSTNTTTSPGGGGNQKRHIFTVDNELTTTQSEAAEEQSSTTCPQASNDCQPDQPLGSSANESPIMATTTTAQTATTATTITSSFQPTTTTTKTTTTSKSTLQASNQLRQQTASETPDSAYQQQSFRQKIFTIRGNHKHVVAIYPDENKLTVWDIYEEKIVRVINDIDHPRDLRMIDQKRAVILCNRELRVYDLDSGTLLTKLKGVMNQKMPYFEIFGQNYVIALARNRMYVNMLNINTGELETTFKVGEDRFLNSLLVSADGGICVCGDETQKPFPLLVWNLNERRLMYDLRLDRHEFLTRMSAISDDGHFVVSVCKQLGDTTNDSSSSYNISGGAAAAGDGNGSVDPTTMSTTTSSGLQPKSSPNFIVIYDLNSGTLFNKWKPGLDTCGVTIYLTSNRCGKLINSIVDNSILVWDLTTGSKRHTLTGHSAPADVIKVQSNRLFSMDSTGRDQSLRIWDLDEGCCLASFNPEAPVSCCQISIRGDALVCGFVGESRLSTLTICNNNETTEGGDVLKQNNKRRKSSKSLYIFDEPPPNRKPSS